MLPLSICWLAAAALRDGGPVYFIVLSTPSFEQHKLEKLKIFALLHDFLDYFLTCCCYSQGWGVCLFHGAKHPFMQSMWAKNWKSLLNYMILLLFWLGTATLKAARGPVYFMVQIPPSCKQHELEKLKKIALLHDFLVYFLTCCCCPQVCGAVYFMVQSTLFLIENIFSFAWFPCLFFWLDADALRAKGLFISWCKAPLHASIVSWKIENLCSIACFPCLFLYILLLPSWLEGLFFSWCKVPLSSKHCEDKNWKSLLFCMISLSIFDLLLLPSGLGGLFISWYKAPLHANIASLKMFENLCFIVCFPCLFFDLLLLSSWLGSLFICWCEAPFNVINVS